MLLEKDLRAVYMDRYQGIPAMIPDMYDIATSDAAYERSTQVGPVPDHQQFNGKIAVAARTQGLGIIVALVKFGHMLENLVQVSITDKVKIWKIEIISRKDFFGGLLGSSMVRVGY